MSSRKAYNGGVRAILRKMSALLGVCLNEPKEIYSEATIV